MKTAGEWAKELRFQYGKLRVNKHLTADEADEIAAYLEAGVKELKPVWKSSLKDGYGYCICRTLTGGQVIVSRTQNYCPNCGVRLLWAIDDAKEATGA